MYRNNTGDRFLRLCTHNMGKLLIFPVQTTHSEQKRRKRKSFAQDHHNMTCKANRNTVRIKTAAILQDLN